MCLQQQANTLFWICKQQASKDHVPAALHCTCHCRHHQALLLCIAVKQSKHEPPTQLIVQQKKENGTTQTLAV
jgi:hypothetical protein